MRWVRRRRAGSLWQGAPRSLAKPLLPRRNAGGWRLWTARQAPCASTPWGRTGCGSAVSTASVPARRTLRRKYWRYYVPGRALFSKRARRRGRGPATATRYGKRQNPLRAGNHEFDQWCR